MPTAQTKDATMCGFMMMLDAQVLEARESLASGRRETG
jgi:hypothetical protein